MLQSISWSNYFSTLTFLFILYYLFIFYVYFKWDILKKFGIHKVDGGQLSVDTVEPILSHYNGDNREDHIPASSGTDLSQLIESYTDEVKAFLEAAAENQMVKEEILFGLQQISAKHPIFCEASTKEGIIIEIYRLTVRQFPNLITVQEIRPYLFS